MFRNTVAALALVPLLLACFRKGPAAALVCTTVSPSIVAAAGEPVYGGCDVDTRVAVGRTPPVQFMPQQLGRVGCFIVIFQFVVDSTGLAVAGTESIITASDRNMGRVVLEQIHNTQYVPATKAGRRVAQLVQVRKGSNITRWTRNYDGSLNPEFDSFAPC